MVVIIQNDPRVPAGISNQSGDVQIVCPYDQHSLPDLRSVDAVIVLGGYMSFDEENTYRYLHDVKKYMQLVVDADLPLLGICLGAQMLADMLGAKVYRNKGQEKGLCAVSLTEAGERDPIFSGYDTTFTAFQWHHDSFDTPRGATQLASSEQCPSQAFRYHHAYGVQFHPEVTPLIVNDWCQHYGGCKQLAKQFARGSFRHNKQHEQLFHNFTQVVKAD